LGQNYKCLCNNDLIYGIVKSNKVRRLTFSKDLAFFIKGKNKNHEIWLLDLVQVGLKEGPCIYGIVGHKNSLLRATVSYEEALFLTEDSNRYIEGYKIRGKKLIEK
jgi:hypothetical protein